MYIIMKILYNVMCNNDNSNINENIIIINSNDNNVCNIINSNNVCEK